MCCAVMLMLMGFSESKGTAEMSPQPVFSLTVAPVMPQNPRNSEAAIIPLKSSALLLGWTEFYAGNGADHGPARISGKVSTDGGKTWGEKYTLVENDGGCNVMEVNFLRLSDGSIALFHCQKNTEESDCRVCGGLFRAESAVRSRFEATFKDVHQSTVYRCGELRGTERLAELGRALYRA